MMSRRSDGVADLEGDDSKLSAADWRRYMQSRAVSDDDSHVGMRKAEFR